MVRDNVACDLGGAFEDLRSGDEMVSSGLLRVNAIRA